MDKEKISISDDLGFVHEVVLEYFPHFGFTNAVYRESIIGQCELNRLLYPASDNDAEHEAYDEALSEWKDEMKVNLIPMCKTHFKLIRASSL